MTKFIVVFLLFFIKIILAQSNFFIVTTDSSVSFTQDDSYNSPNSSTPKIINFHAKSIVSNRFSETTVTSFVQNFGDTPEQTTFSVVLPERAFISGFYMKTGGKKYQAYVKEKEDAKNVYDENIENQKSAAHVFLSTRYSNRFTVKTNVEPKSNISFHLTYEELLQRRDGQYEIVINIQPGQIIQNLEAEIIINENQPIKFINTPNLRSGNVLLNVTNNSLNPDAEVNRVNDTFAIIKFHPDFKKQLEYACAGLGGTQNDDGFSGQYIVQYDLERNPSGAEILFQDGFFINYFTPTNLEPLSKHVIFVLDTSGSMDGVKIDQVKDAMSTILYELNPDDVFHLVEFNWHAKVWNMDGTFVENLKAGSDDLHTRTDIPIAAKADSTNIDNAELILESKFIADGSTNIMEAMEIALFLVEQTQTTFENNLPMIIFLTDGNPMEGITSTDEIISRVTQMNKNQVNIYTLSFGEDANQTFLHSLAHLNNGFTKHIYESEDAAVFLRGFYRDISNPLLKDIQFSNIPVNSDTTNTNFPIFFNGSEIVIAGRGSSANTSSLMQISGKGKGGNVMFTPEIGVPVTKLERIWAYIRVKQLLDDSRASAQNSTELLNLALNISLSYSLVTEVSSLIVVKPNETTAVNTQDAFEGVIPKPPSELPMCKNLTIYILENEVYFGSELITDTEETTTELTTTTETTTEEASTATTEITTITPSTTTQRVILCNETQFGCCHDQISSAAGPNYLDCDPEHVAESCGQPKDRGACTNYEIKWYYDINDGECQRFKYGGCGGNGNRFSSRELCKKICVQSAGVDRCGLPEKIKGPCTGSVIRWSYNKIQNKCSQFTFGGCSGTGNFNNFETEKECLDTCDVNRKGLVPSVYESCGLAPDHGNGSNYNLFYYFDKTDGLCRRFWYGGNGGNMNRFKTFDECNNACVQAPEKEKCNLPKIEGPCVMNQSAWFFDNYAKECKPFTYGGCYGNNNRFDTKLNCIKSCKPPPGISSPNSIQNACYLRENRGSCSRWEIKWTYNQTFGRCTQFWYGGCKGNSNRFNTEEDCINICVNPAGKDRCYLPKIRGQCNQPEKRWYFNDKQQKCILFIYNGCFGNSNRFSTKQECEATCL